MSALMPAAPAERLAAVRILVGVFALLYLAIRAAHIIGLAGFEPEQFQPIGVLTLAGLPPRGVVIALTAATWLALVGFTLGWRFRATGPAAALLLLWTLTYSNSWGQIFHTENALVLYVLVLAVTRSADAWSLDARRAAAPPPAPDPRYGWPLRLLCAVVVATYFIAGVAKLRWAGAGWMGGTVLRDVIAADSMRKVLLGSSHSPLADLVLDHTWLLAGLAVGTLVLEVGAPLALLHRRIALVWVLGVIGFHLGVLALMAIFFPFPTSGVAFAPFFRAERLIERLRSWWRRRRGRPEPD